MADLTTPCPGDLLRVGREASVQFRQPILFRVIRVLNWTTYDGWIWLEGYQLNGRGDAVDRRAIFVQPAGLRTAPAPVAVRRSGRKRVSSKRCGTASAGTAEPGPSP
ncbi:hypothetical protein [Micromonospora craniellae]|uniref:hypothetical protein n=1 Tax=Micromonospora craniellae TaxID=2294034 RepID=UPI0013142E42|nr:hypothetical protein [Micromonospora craniellae]QOC89795.1 hypothetical protein ID554_16220 [Micromonospora craniellae]